MQNGKIKALFVDFYGTIVHEDGEVIKKITDIIQKTGVAEDKSEIDSFWWKDFQTMFQNSYAESIGRKLSCAYIG